MTKVRKLRFKGIDDWDRPLYQDEQGIWYCHVNLGGPRPIDMCYKLSKNGEPEDHVPPSFYEIVEPYPGQHGQTRTSDTT